MCFLLVVVRVGLAFACRSLSSSYVLDGCLFFVSVCPLSYSCLPPNSLLCSRGLVLVRGLVRCPPCVDCAPPSPVPFVCGRAAGRAKETERISDPSLDADRNSGVWHNHSIEATKQSTKGMVAGRWGNTQQSNHQTKARRSEEGEDISTKPKGSRNTSQWQRVGDGQPHKQSSRRDNQNQTHQTTTMKKNQEPN